MEATIAFDDDVELEYVPFFSLEVFAILTEVWVMYFESVAKFTLACEVVVQSQLPHTQFFPWRFDQAPQKNT